MRTKIIFCIVVAFLMIIAEGCIKDEEFTESIFTESEELNPESPTYIFDSWLIENFQKPYNLTFEYKLNDVSSNLNYNLVPTSLEKSKQLAQLIKYLWFDVYAKMLNEDFLKKYGPRMIHLIGSPAYNPNSGTILLGTAEGGIKVTLYRCNGLDFRDVVTMNEYYFKTMHHEFTHILHQTKSYPKNFENISAGNYSPLGWQFISDEDAAKMGFVSPYAASQAREDFVEIIANYLVKSDDDWNNVLNLAGDEGKDIILQKLVICTAWLKDKWGIDILAMRNEIAIREKNIDANFFRNDL